MSDDVTRIGLDEESDGSRTEWSQLRRLSDEEIEGAVAADPDAYLLDHGEAGRPQGSYQYQFYRTPGGEWRWRLVDASGAIMAVGGQAYPTRRAVEAAITILRDALLGARSKAA